jgi:hypothetical protein
MPDRGTMKTFCDLDATQLRNAGYEHIHICVESGPRPSLRSLSCAQGHRRCHRNIRPFLILVKLRGLFRGILT